MTKYNFYLGLFYQVVEYFIKTRVSFLNELGTCHKCSALTEEWLGPPLADFTQVMRHINSEQRFGYCSELNLVL